MTPPQPTIMEDNNENDHLEEDIDFGDDDGNEQEEENNNLVTINPPEPGMHFNSVQELHECYKKFGKQEGFRIRKDSTNILKDGQSKLISLVCSRAGKHRSIKQNLLKPKPITKTDCKARCNAHVSVDGKCRVTSIRLEHNHGLSPRKAHYYFCHKGISKSTRRQLESSDQDGIHVTNNSDYFEVKAGGHENVPYLGKDARNFLEKSRRLKLGVGDAASILAFFGRMQAKNSNFYHNIEVDEDNRIKHMFWADARSRAAYEEFGDVVTFDTTYLINKYDMPFVTFVGVNHHGESVLLGCALLSNEDTDAFQWLFSAWLSCMSNRPPNAIITDQDEAMKKAIENVFPNAQHRWCLRHIMKKLQAKLSGYSMYSQIRHVIENVVYDSLTVTEFEDCWARLICQYNLMENDWLSGLYKERRRWVPAFVKDTFCAGMLTTQRSESMNVFFDKYVNSKTTSKQFVEQYENALKSKVQEENHADHQSFNTYVPCVTHFEIEKQFQEVYTNAKFSEIQVEITTAKLYCEVSFVKDDDWIWEFDVSEDVDKNGKRILVNFKVYLTKETNDVRCACRLFDFKGILCRHAFSVFFKKDVRYAPNKYILPRWMKTLRRRHTRVKVGYDDWSGNPEAQRYNELHKHFDEVSDFAVVSDILCNKLHELFFSYEEEAKKIQSDCRSSLPTSSSNIVGTGCGKRKEQCARDEEREKILDPILERNMGCSPTNTVKTKKKKNSHKEKIFKVTPSLDTFPKAQDSLNIDVNAQPYHVEHQVQLPTTCDAYLTQNMQLTHLHRRNVSFPQHSVRPVVLQQMSDSFSQQLASKPPLPNHIASSQGLCLHNTGDNQEFDGKRLP